MFGWTGNNDRCRYSCRGLFAIKAGGFEKESDVEELEEEA
jgi:hypothetical protein